MKKNKLKVLSILALGGLAVAGLTACTVNVNPTQEPTAPSQTSVPTTTVTPTTTTSTSESPSKVIDTLDVSGYKSSYTVGETFTLEGLEVVKYYENGDYETATSSEYVAKLYSDEACTTEANVTAFETVGTYYLKITIGSKSSKKEITVTAAQYEVKQLFDASALTAGDIVADKELYNNKGFVVTALASEGKKMTVEGNSYPGESSNANVGDYKFTNRLKLNGSALGTGETALNVENGEVTNDRVVKIVVPHAATIRIAARSGSSGTPRTLVLTDNANVNKEIAALDDADMDAASVAVEAGTYYLYSKSSGINIYGIEFVYSVDKSSIQYSELKVESTKTEFNINDTYTKEGLTVKALNQYGVWDTITNYEVKNADGSDVVLNVPGNKELTVKVGELEVKYTISVVALDAKTQTLTVTTPAKDLVYKQGEELSFTNLVITAVDQYNISTEVVVSDALALETPTVTYKVFQGETDVTSNWATLSAGKYSVKLTYDDATTSYEVTVVTKADATYNVPNVLAIGAAIFNSSITINYSDGTNVIASEAVNVPSTTEGYTTTFYSDEACTQAITIAQASAQAGTVYVKVDYAGYTSTAVAVTVKEITSESAIAANLGVENGTDYKGQTLYSGNLITLDVLSGSTKGELKEGINNGNATLKIDESTGTKGVKITAAVKVTLTIQLNASGSGKTIQIAKADGTLIKEVAVGKSNTNTEETITLNAGESIIVYSVGGGGRFVGVVATKAD